MPYMEDGTPVDIVLNPLSSFKDECWPDFRDSFRSTSVDLGKKFFKLAQQSRKQKDKIKKLELYF